MDLPADSWYKAIFIRKSRRIYTGRIPDDEKIIQLEKVCMEFIPFREVRAEFVKRPPDRVFKGAVGSYGMVKNAPCYIAFIGDMTSPNAQEMAGYTGEGIILEATSLGLDTCWVGGFFRPKIVKNHIFLSKNEKVLAVTPVGYAEGEHTLQEKLIKWFCRSSKRKSLEELVGRKIIFEWAEKALEAASLAPSAVNRQPWRFKVEGNSIIVSTDERKNGSNISRRLDCGIAMLHLELGTLVSGKKGTWEFLSPPQVAKFTVYE